MNPRRPPPGGQRDTAPNRGRGQRNASASTGGCGGEKRRSRNHRWVGITRGRGGTGTLRRHRTAGTLYRGGEWLLHRHGVGARHRIRRRQGRGTRIERADGPGDDALGQDLHIGSIGYLRGIGEETGH